MNNENENNLKKWYQQNGVLPRFKGMVFAYSFK